MFDIKQLIPSEFCLECDGCCRFQSGDSVWFPRLLKKERVVLKYKNSACSNLGAGNKCKIYKKRPFDCALYPFLINRDTASGKVFLSVHLSCPFVARNMKNEDFKEYTAYLAAFMKSWDFLKMLKNNPQIIQSYTEILNLVELPHEIE